MFIDPFDWGAVATLTKTKIMSKTMEKVELAIYNLSNVKGRTSHESKRLANAIVKKEAKGISKIYSTLAEAEGLLKVVVDELLGEYKFPTFKEFQSKAKEGVEYWSVWIGLGVLKEFNIKAKAKDKATRQQRKEDGKTMEVAKPEQADILDKLMELVESKPKAKAKAKGKAKVAA